MNARFGWLLVLGALLLGTLLVVGCESTTYSTAPVPSLQVNSGHANAMKALKPADTPGSGSQGSGTKKSDITYVVPQDPGQPGSASFALNGSRGGTFTYGRYTLVFPPGAVAGNGTVTIAVTDPSVVGCDLSISPSTLNSFSQPVTLQMNLGLTNVTDQNGVTLQTWLQVDGGWQSMGGTYRAAATGMFEITTLPHFSCYRAGW